MHEEVVDGDPTKFSDDDWRQWAQVVVGYDKICLTFVVDLPPLGRGDYDERVGAMTRALHLHLNELISGIVTVAESTRNGGMKARVSYDITVHPKP